MKRPADRRHGFGAGSKNIRCLAGGLALLLASLWSPDAAVAGSGQEAGDARRGRAIYVSGRDSAGAEIKCTTGAPGSDSSAAVLKCVNCHGADGRGQPEGGAYPSSIRWSELSKPYPVLMPSGRKRPPYSAAAIERAVASGIDPSGAPLGPAMPRYRLSPGAAADLVAYFKELDAAEEPGVGVDRITLCVMLPPERSAGAAGLAIRETLVAAFDEVNRAGGIYGRRFQCRFVTAPEQGLAGAWEAALAREKPFAVLASCTEGAEAEVSRLIEREGVPFIQPLPLTGHATAPAGRYLFTLVADWATQCAALAQFAAEKNLLTGAPSVVLTDAAGATGPILERIAALAKSAGGPVPRIIRADEVTDWAAVLRSSQGAALFWLGGGESLEKLFQAAERAGIYPTLLAPASSAGSRMMHAPAGFAGHLYLGVSTVPGDAEPDARADFFRLAESARFTESELPTRLTALSAAKVLMELVRQSGRELTREKVVALAERLYEFHPGYTRPVTFTRSRRMGAAGAHVTGLDLAQGRLELPAHWVEAQPPQELGDPSLPLSGNLANKPE